jgi:hypothetical protein
MENIVIRFWPELRDQIRASIAHYRAGILRTCDRIAGTAALVAGFTFFLFCGLPWWSLAVFCFVGFAEWSDIFHAHTLRAWLSFKRNKKFRHEFTVTFSREGMHFKTVSIDSNIAWSLYDSVIEDSVIFLLMSGKSMWSVIPKRAFKDEDEANQFRTIVQAAIPKYNKQRF